MRIPATGQRAFTLIELSIVLVIVAVIVGASFTAGRPIIEAARTRQTQDKIAAIHEALHAFRKAHSRLPCPSSLTLATTSGNFGVEGLTTANCIDATVGNATATNLTVDTFTAEGNVPVRTLGLPDDFAFDGWKNRILYAVSTGFVASNAFLSYPPGMTCNSTAKILDGSGASNYRTQNALYVLASLGPNAHGVYNRAGSQLNAASTANTDEQQNCHCNGGPAYDGKYVEKAATQDYTDANNNFDDIVDYRMRHQLRVTGDGGRYGAGDIWVVDRNNNRVQKFDADGNYVSQFGSGGSGSGQFSGAWGITIDANHTMWVTDFSDNRIQKFDFCGNYLGQLGCAGTSACSSGSANGELSNPWFATSDNSNNIYVADSGNNRVQKFDANGTFLFGIGAGYNGISGAIGSAGSGNGQFDTPRGTSLDTDNNVWIVDALNYRVQKFDANGNYAGQITGSSGSANGQFINHSDTAVDGNGNIWVADRGNNRVQKFDANGTFLMAIGAGYNGISGSIGSSGSGSGQFSNPNAIAIDAHNNIWVSDKNNHRIQKFDTNGAFLTAIGAGYNGISGAIGSSGSGNGQFDAPIGVVVY